MKRNRNSLNNSVTVKDLWLNWSQINTMILLGFYSDWWRGDFMVGGFMAWAWPGGQITRKEMVQAWARWSHSGAVVAVTLWKLRLPNLIGERREDYVFWTTLGPDVRIRVVIWRKRLVGRSASWTPLMWAQGSSDITRVVSDDVAYQNSWRKYWLVIFRNEVVWQ